MRRLADTVNNKLRAIGPRLCLRISPKLWDEASTQIAGWLDRRSNGPAHRLVAGCIYDLELQK